MMSMGQPLWDDIKILGYVSKSICLYVCMWDIDLGCPMLIILGVTYIGRRHEIRNVIFFGNRGLRSTQRFYT